MTLPPPLTLTFWFQTSPPPLLPIYERLLLVLVAAFVITGSIALIARLRRDFDKLTRRALGMAGNMLLTTGLVGLLLYVFVYERIRYLSMRIWLVVWLTWIVWWAWKIIQFVTVRIPEIQKQRAEQERLNKWLPKKK